MKNNNKLDEFEEKLQGDTERGYGFYVAVVTVFFGILGWCSGIVVWTLWLIKH